MVNMVRWDPFREMAALRNAVDRMFSDSFARASANAQDMGIGELPLNIYQTDDNVMVKAYIPGIKPEEVDISIAEDVLTIKGEQKAEEEIKEGDYLLREYRHGAFSRSIRLPAQVEHEKVEAVYEDGVLTLTLPKAEETKPKQIKIKATPLIEGGKKK